ncbi:hypothetical protein [Peptacetobacter sp.]|uniref:hypothetical protein n=1 Tax=unclassified Peptacetobacter TaxID=2991974 RepID=UPI0026193EA3|nr:hypothetical protein [Peptacetobacter sp.]MEE0451557.1 hypothetical protein [Peptacetobacter sp.]
MLNKNAISRILFYFVFVFMIYFTGNNIHYVSTLFIGALLASVIFIIMSKKSENVIGIKYGISYSISDLIIVFSAILYQIQSGIYENIVVPIVIVIICYMALVIYYSRKK